MKGFGDDTGDAAKSKALTMLESRRQRILHLGAAHSGADAPATHIIPDEEFILGCLDGATTYEPTPASYDREARSKAGKRMRKASLASLKRVPLSRL